MIPLAQFIYKQSNILFPYRQFEKRFAYGPCFFDKKRLFKFYCTPYYD